MLHYTNACIVEKDEKLITKLKEENNELKEELVTLRDTLHKERMSSDSSKCKTHPTDFFHLKLYLSSICNCLFKH